MNVRASFQHPPATNSLPSAGAGHLPRGRLPMLLVRAARPHQVLVPARGTAGSDKLLPLVDTALLLPALYPPATPLLEIPSPHSQLTSAHVTHDI